jgi:hypothetical protein
VDFVSDQSDRTRQEMMNRLVAEFSKVLQTVDIRELMNEMIEGRTIEAKMEIKLGDKGSD